MTPAVRARGVLLAVALTAVLVYAPTLAYEFVWDDLILIRDRLHLYTAANLGPLLLSDLFSGSEWGESSFFRPLVVLSYFVDLKLWGLTPFGFHLTNVVAHALASLCVARLARRLTGNAVATATAGVLFAVHPVLTPAVAFVSGRTDVFATLFALVSVVAYMRWRESHARRDLVGSVAAYALALCSKEVAAIVPILLVLSDVVVRRNGWSENAPRGRRGALVRMAPYVAVLAAYVGIRRLALATFVMAPATPWADGVMRVLTTVKMAAWYVRLAILPYPTTLSYEVTPERFPPGVVWCAAAVMLALTLGATLVAMRRWPVVGFGAGWFWIALVPMLGASLLPTRKPLMADNFLYLSMAGFAVIVGAVAPCLLGVGEIARGARVRPRAAFALGIVLVGYGAFTLWRSADWRDEDRLTLRSVATSPNAAHPRVNLALNQLQQGDVAGARANLAFAVTRAPDDAVIAAALGFAEIYLGDREGGLRHTLRAQELAPDNPVALRYVAESYVRLGDLPRAAQTLQRSLRLKPDQVPATMTLATVQHLLGRDDDALVTLERGIGLNERTHQHDLLMYKVTAQLTAKRDPARARTSWGRYVTALKALPQTPQVDAEIASAQHHLQLLPSSR